jgi:hypothetical protein
MIILVYTEKNTWQKWTIFQDTNAQLTRKEGNVLNLIKKIYKNYS